jgi:hypothetical protein
MKYWFFKIAKGQTPLYDIQFDKTNYLVNAILRK